MIIGYARVSSHRQLKEGYGLDAQAEEILRKYPGVKIVQEQFTGSVVKERPELKKLINELKENDILVVSKLDRLARTTEEGLQIVKELFSRGVSVHVLNVGLLEDTSMGNFFLTTLLAVAEMEKNLILERTQAGKAIAKKDPDFREGRPPALNRAQIEHAMELLEHKTYKEVCELLGVSRSTLARVARKHNLYKK